MISNWSKEEKTQLLIEKLKTVEAVNTAEEAVNTAEEAVNTAETPDRGELLTWSVKTPSWGLNTEDDHAMGVSHLEERFDGEMIEAEVDAMAEDLLSYLHVTGPQPKLVHELGTQLQKVEFLRA